MRRALPRKASSSWLYANNKPCTDQTSCKGNSHTKTPKKRNNGVGHERDSTTKSLKLSVPHVHIWCAKTSSHAKTNSRAKTKTSCKDQLSCKDMKKEKENKGEMKKPPTWKLKPSAHHANSRLNHFHHANSCSLKSLSLSKLFMQTYQNQDTIMVFYGSKLDKYHAH